MAQYIDKTVIENILHKLWKKDKGFGYTDTRIAYNKALQAVQYELDTIEEKEVDLEDEFDEYLEKQNTFTVDGNGEIKCYNGASISHVYDIYPIAKYFFELGLKYKK